MAIPQQFLDELNSRVDLVSEIDQRVPLKRAGKEYIACCPFHSEKSPSFSVSPQKQFYHCFGCGAHGNAITFVMEYDRIPFIDAVEMLASKVGMQVPKSSVMDDKQIKKQRTIHDTLAWASGYYQQNLKAAGAESDVVEYLKSRGLSGETAKKFGIGFAKPGWNNLEGDLGKGEKGREELIQAGLVIEKEDKKSFYDRFRNRVMFPIRDRLGRVIAFGGRVMGDDKPKYLNSPETDVFHKGRELYGLYEVMQAHKKPERILVVEGYMDVVMLAQHGVDYAVAALGTATSKEHIEVLQRNTDEIIFCFDGDNAGRQAAWKALEAALPVIKDGKELFFLFLPDGEDPDSYINQHGAVAFEDLVFDHVEPLTDFMIKSLKRDIDTSTTSGKARLIEVAKAHITKMPKGVFREMTIHQLAQEAGIDAHSVGGMLFGKTKPKKESKKTKKTFASKKDWRKARQKQQDMERFYIAGAEERKAVLSPSRIAIKHVLNNTALATEVGAPEELKQSHDKGALALIEIIELIQNDPDISVASIVSRWEGKPEHKVIAMLAAERVELSAEKARAEYEGACKRLTIESIEKRISEIESKDFSEMTDSEKQELLELTQKQQSIAV